MLSDQVEAMESYTKQYDAYQQNKNLLWSLVIFVNICNMYIIH